MKLFLASSLDKTISLLSQKWSKSPQETRVLFIANAADPYTGDKFWIRWDREAFTRLGYQITEIDLREISEEDFVKHLNNTDILHICGGSVLYVTNLIRKQGLESIIVEAVKTEKVFYSSTSAGSMIVASHLDLCIYDQEELEFVPDMKTYLGLGLVNFLILPHCNQELFKESSKRIMDHLPEHPQPLVLIQDNQVVWVEDQKFEILSV